MHVQINRPIAVTDNGQLRQFDPGVAEVSDEVGRRLIRAMAAQRVPAPAPEPKRKGKTGVRKGAKANPKSKPAPAQDREPNGAREAVERRGENGAADSGQRASRPARTTLTEE